MTIPNSIFYAIMGILALGGAIFILGILGLIISAFFIPGLLPAGIALIIVIAVMSALLAPLRARPRSRA